MSHTHSAPAACYILTEQSVNNTYSCKLPRSNAFLDKIRSRRHRASEHAEVRDQTVDVPLIVLH